MIGTQHCRFAFKASLRSRSLRCSSIYIYIYRDALFYNQCSKYYSEHHLPYIGARSASEKPTEPVRKKMTTPPRFPLPPDVLLDGSLPRSRRPTAHPPPALDPPPSQPATEPPLLRRPSRARAGIFRPVVAVDLSFSAERHG